VFVCCNLFFLWSCSSLYNVSLCFGFFLHLSPLFFLQSLSFPLKFPHFFCLSPPLFLTVKGGETTTTPVQSWHRGREVERLLGSRPRTCPFCFFFFILASQGFRFLGFWERSSVVGEEKLSSPTFAR